MRIEEYIPYGSDNAIKRDALCSVTGMTDRCVREHIEMARKNGVIIINLQDGRGYFRPNDDDYEIVNRQYNQQKSRAMKILAGNKAMSRWLKTVKGQISFS